MRALIAVLGSSLLFSLVACKATSDDNSFGNGKAGSSSGGSAGTAGTAGSIGGSAGTGATAGTINGSAGSSGSAGSTGVAHCDDTDMNSDHDGDGWSENEGDCNDCDANSNPGAIDVLNFKRDDQGNILVDANNQPILADSQVDEDCDGTALTAASPACDGNLQPGAVNNPMDAAVAMGICNVNVEANPADKKNKKWGVIQAKFVDIASDWFGAGVQQSTEPMELNYGILPGFGSATKPQEGLRLFSLSAGQARYPGAFGYQDPGFLGDNTTFNKGYTCGNPQGFPKSSACGSTEQPHDGVALDLEIRVPTNAKSFSFQFKFFTYEFPVYVCQMFNDTFAMLMDPSPQDPADPMWPDVAFETTSNGSQNVISVNNKSFLKYCTAGSTGYDCSLGESGLAGSGFEGHGASEWLQSTVPIPASAQGGGTIRLRLAIWDSSDGALDSTAVVDNIVFKADEGQLGTVIIDDPIQ